MPCDVRDTGKTVRVSHRPPTHLCLRATTRLRSSTLAGDGALPPVLPSPRGATCSTPA